MKTETDSERHKMTTQRRSTTTTVHETMTRRPRGTTKTQSVDIETRKRLQRRDMTTTRHKVTTRRHRKTTKTHSHYEEMQNNGDGTHKRRPRDTITTDKTTTTMRLKRMRWRHKTT